MRPDDRLAPPEAVPSTSKVRLTGWKAVTVVALLVAYVVYRHQARRVTIDPAARDAIRSWVVAQYERSALAQLPLVPQVDSTAADELLRSYDVEIRSMTARGWSDNVVARVEIAVHGGPPSDNRPVRYLRLLRLARSGWRVVGESNPVSYYTRSW